MKKRITEYRKRVDRLLADEEEKTYEEWECILEEHLVQDRKSTRLNSSHFH